MTDAQVEHLANKIKAAAAAHYDVGLADEPPLFVCRIIARYLIENGAWEVPFTYGGAMHPQIMQEELDEMIAKQKEMLGE